MITCIALDDEPLALDLLQNFASKIPSIGLQKTFTDPEAAAKHLRKFPVDLLFLDIQMPDISGIDFYKSLAQNVMVIFTTAHSEYAVEGFNLSAVDYLLKPYEFSRFEQAVQRAQEYYNFIHQKSSENNNFIYVRADYSLIKIDCNEIEYIEGLDDYIKIFLTGKKPVLTLMSLKGILEKLPAKNFARVHRSFIVPFAKISHIRNKKIQLTSAEVPIGASHEEAFMKAFQEGGGK